MTTEPEHIDWPHAVDRLAGLIERGATSGGRPIVGITGPAGAGKSTLSARLADATGGLVISTDEYLPDYRVVPEAERDLPEHADLALLARHLAALREGEAAEIPVWSFHEHRRVDTRRVEPTPGPVICEGLFALHEAVAGVVDLRVYVDASPGTRWGRWEAIERRGERGMGVEAAKDFFETVADPTYARYAEVYRASAHVVVRNDADLGNLAETAPNSGPDMGPDTDPDTGD